MIPSKQAEEPASLLSLFARCMTSRLVKLTGRARRREYWAYLLFALICGALLGGLLSLALSRGLLDLARPLGIVIVVVIGVLALWLLVAGLSVTVRRFHDCNLPAWPVYVGVVLLFLPGPLFYTPLGGIGGPGFFVLAMLLAACALIGILGVAIIPGGRKKNRYGPAPKEYTN